MDYYDGLYNMYREVDELALLNKLFVTILSEHLNINNYLINTSIKEKISLKDTLEDMDYILLANLDDLKYLIKMKKGYPIYKLEDIELISAIKTKEAGEYKEDLVTKNVKEEVNVIINLSRDIISKLEPRKSYEVIEYYPDLILIWKNRY